MKSASDTLPPGTTGAPDGTQPSRPYTPGLSDGLGDRLMMFDNATQSSVELLRFKREFGDAPGFEEAISDRIEELSRFKHPAVAPVRGVQMLDDGLALMSNNTPGRRLSEMVHVARGAPFAMDLIQQLAPALSALHQLGPRVAHGLLTAERIIITREGKLIVVEHVLASAFEQLRLPASRYRSEFGIAVPAGADPVGLNQRSDVVQLGFVALSLLLGRRLDPAHYPANVATLLDEFTQADAASSARLRPWLERALQQADRPFASAQEAHAAFGGPAAETVRTAPAGQTPATGTPRDGAHAVLAFRSPGESAEPTPIRLKADIPQAPVTRPDATESRSDAHADAGDQKKSDTHTPPPASSVASPKSSGSGNMKWIGIAAAVVVVVAGGLFAAGLVGKHPAEPGTAVADVKPPQPAPVAAPPPVAVPLPPSSTPAFGLTTDGKSATPSATGQDAAGVSSKSPAAGASLAGLAGSETAPAGGAPRVAGGFGGVKVTSAIELQVYENGALVGSTAGPIALIEGSHVFELVNESLGFRVRSTIAVRGGQMTPLAIAVPNGRLSINAVPWAEVFIDGKPAGQTPLANVMVPIGQHKVVFKHPDLGEQTENVIVKADGLTRVSATFKS